MTRNLQMLIAYDGTEFHGWQTQANLRTVQAEVENVTRRVLRHRVGLIASGRTDAGVHAAGQVANVHTDSSLECHRLYQAMCHRLPRDIRLLRVRDVPAGFHATRSAISKLYRYRIYNHHRRPAPGQQSFVYRYHKPLDAGLMNRAARQFLGTQDFSAMASTSSTPRTSNVRTILRCEVYRAYDEIRIDVQGTGFLYNQVRNMVGTLLDIGRGRWPADCIVEILGSKDRQNAGPTAPAQGLCLQWVEYPPDHLISNGAEPIKPPDRKQAVEAVS